MVLIMVNWSMWEVKERLEYRVTIRFWLKLLQTFQKRNHRVVYKSSVLAVFESEIDT